MTFSRSPQCSAFSRAMMDEKALSPLFPVGGPTGQWLQIIITIIITTFKKQVQLGENGRVFLLRDFAFSQQMVLAQLEIIEMILTFRKTLNGVKLN